MNTRTVMSALCTLMCLARGRDCRTDKAQHSYCPVWIGQSRSDNKSQRQSLTECSTKIYFSNIIRIFLPYLLNAHTLRLRCEFILSPVRLGLANCAKFKTAIFRSGCDDGRRRIVACFFFAWALTVLKKRYGFLASLLISRRIKHFECKRENSN